MEEILLAHQKRYAEMEAIDYYKLIYQQTFGSYDDQINEKDSLEKLTEEYIGIDKTKTRVFHEPIGNGYVRVHLGAEEISETTLSLLNKFFIRSTNRRSGTIEQLEERLERAVELAKEEKLTVDAQDLAGVFQFYKERCYPPASQSKVYHEQYDPHYRVLAASYLEYLPVLEYLVELAKGDTPKLIAIDGRCGSGKTTFAQVVKEVLDCNVFHMDDFFLPIEMKTEERLGEPGGNVHYERVLEEVIQPLMKRREVKLVPFDCSINDLDKLTVIPYKKFNVIEGVYSFHPALEEYYDVKIFVTTDPGTQIQRIKERGHEAKLHRFINEWIPLEEKYIENLRVNELADFVIHTGDKRMRAEK